MIEQADVEQIGEVIPELLGLVLVVDRRVAHADPDSHAAPVFRVEDLVFRKAPREWLPAIPRVTPTARFQQAGLTHQTKCFVFRVLFFGPRRRARSRLRAAPRSPGG